MIHAIRRAGASIADLMRTRRIRAHYQPIVSLKKQCILGFETTCYGLHPETGEELPIRSLYRQAEEEGLFVEFDRHCRDIALEALAALHKVNPVLQLFLPFDSSVLNHGVVGSNYLLEQVRARGLSPQSVVIEIVESAVRDDRALARFVRAYQKQGFLIGLSGLGRAQLNLQRIPLVRPNVVQIEGALINELADSPLDAIVVRAIVQLANSLGALVVVNGITSVEAGVVATELGIDMLQGDLFGAPQKLRQRELLSCQAHIREIAQNAKHELSAQIKRQRAQRRTLAQIAFGSAAYMTGLASEQFAGTMQAIIAQQPAIECLYVLSERGIQIGDTVCSPSLVARIGSMFQPDRDRTDQSMKEYFYRRQDLEGDLYQSEPYVSLASGHTCVTLSLPFVGALQQDYLLCVDIIV